MKRNSLQSKLIFYRTILISMMQVCNNYMIKLADFNIYLMIKINKLLPKMDKFKI